MTGAVWLRARAEMRARWRALLSAGILCGLFGAAVLAALSGAERTEEAYPRFLERQEAYDLIISDTSFFAPVFWQPDFDRLARLPYVESAARFIYGGLEKADAGASEEGFIFVASTDPNFGRTIQRPVVVEGRVPNPERVDEVTVPFFADGDLAGLRVGDRLNVKAGDEKITITIVGRTVVPGELPPRPLFGWPLVVTPAFVERYGQDYSFNVQSIMLRFNERGDITRFQDDVRAMTEGKIISPQEQESHSRAVEGTTNLQATALRLLALFTALTGAMIIGQLLAREMTIAGEDGPTLRSLGFDRWQIFRLGMIRMLPTALLGGVLTLAFAWLASPYFPRGSVRAIVPSHGFVFDGTTLGLGSVFVVLSVMLVVVVPAWRSSVAARREAEQTERPSRVAAALAAARVSVPAVAGARLALERGRGRSAVPVFSSLLIVSLGVAAFVAATTFATSLNFMLDRPVLYGKTWQTEFSTSDEISPVPGSQDVVHELVADPDVEELALADTGIPIRVYAPTGPERGITVTAMQVVDLKGSQLAPILEGREPEASDELVLGSRMIHALGIVLDPLHPPEVELALQGTEYLRAKFKVVGRAVIPPLGNFGELGFGVMFTSDETLRKALVDQSLIPPITTLIARLRPGVTPEAIVARYKQRYPQLSGRDEIIGGKFADAVSFGGVQGAPLAVGGVLAALGAAALAHVIVTAIRRRRRDVAILKTIGFVRGQARRVVAWQATITVVVAAAAGIPLGLIGGRWLWIQVADRLGVLARPQVTPLLLALLLPAVVVLANLIAALPARSAARTPPALVLRSE